jgi:hypothetical protein
MNLAVNTTIRKLFFEAMYGYILEFRLFVKDNFILKGVLVV